MVLSHSSLVFPHVSVVLPKVLSYSSWFFLYVSVSFLRSFCIHHGPFPFIMVLPACLCGPPYDPFLFIMGLFHSPWYFPHASLVFPMALSHSPWYFSYVHRSMVLSNYLLWTFLHIPMILSYSSWSFPYYHGSFHMSLWSSLWFFFIHHSLFPFTMVLPTCLYGLSSFTIVLCIC